MQHRILRAHDLRRRIRKHPATLEEDRELELQRSILIVEDNLDNRIIYSEVLRHAGYRILEAANGREGVEMSIRHRPDLILMDLSMPVMDGWEAVRAIKRDARTASIPVCALSAHVVVDGDYARSTAAGFACYLTKPIEPKDVLREVERRLAPRAAVGAA